MTTIRRVQVAGGSGALGAATDLDLADAAVGDLIAVADDSPLTFHNVSLLDLIDSTPITAADLGLAVGLPPGSDNNSMWSVGGLQTMPRSGLFGLTGSSGRLWVSYVTPPITVTLGSLGLMTDSTAGASITAARLALFTVDGSGNLTKVAQTAGDATIGAGAYATYTRSLSTTGGFPASYQLVAGQRYAVGFLQVASTAASIRGISVTAESLPPVPSRIIAGQTDIAGTYTAGSLSAHYEHAFLYGVAA